ncbi:MAG: histidine kinase dimerization/phospho-acceptor domain-containing protein [bacterium]|nr:histidine kinase dimerization/phospho-acceptor domain-containing protein [bacterium]
MAENTPPTSLMDTVEAVLLRTSKLMEETGILLEPMQREDLAEIREGTLRLMRLLEKVAAGTWKPNSLVHDLRSPLNIIIGYSEMLLDDKTAPFSDSQRGELNFIHETGLELAKRINELYKED